MACQRRVLALATALLAVLLWRQTSASDEISVSFPSRLEIVADDFKGDSTVPTAAAICKRISVRGLSRLRSPGKFAHSLKLQVAISHASAVVRSHGVQICFHRNSSLGACECPVPRWQKLPKGSWVQKVSPYGDMFLDIRTPPNSGLVLEVSTEVEFSVHRVFFLIVGMIMMMIARVLSESVIFYYGSAMALGVILVILVVLFQGTKLLPTGQRSPLAIFLYSSIVGLATFMLQYLSGLFQLVLIKLGISEDLHNPIGMFLVLCIFVVGAWCGFWCVRRLLLTDDGLVDSDVSYFVEWAIWIFSAAMILQCSLDILLAAEAFSFAVVLSATTRAYLSLKSVDHLFIWVQAIIVFFLRGFTKAIWVIRTIIFQPFEYLYHAFYNQIRESSNKSVPHANRSKPTRLTSDFSKFFPANQSNIYCSSFHKTPERRKFSKEEWEKFTSEQTSSALKDLVSSPDFGRWASENAERLTLAPPRDRNLTKTKRRRCFYWF